MTEGSYSEIEQGSLKTEKYWLLEGKFPEFSLNSFVTLCY